VVQEVRLEQLWNTFGAVICPFGAVMARFGALLVPFETLLNARGILMDRSAPVVQEFRLERARPAAEQTAS
jgi:hypothetical protein